MSDGTTFETIDFDGVEDDDGELTNGRPDDLASAFVGFFTSINYKLIMFIFIIFIFVTSDVFIDKVVSRVDGTVENMRETTNKGAFIQGLCLLLLYMIADLVIQLGFI